MNTEGFTGKAKAYAAARPGYPDEAINYIRSLVSTNAVFADIGAGTGKFTELIAQCGYQVYAVEPNADMREQLIATLVPFSNVEVVIGTAEKSTLPDKSVDVITCAQALGWFDLDDFLDECRRIGKRDAIIISLYNDTPGDNHTPGSHRLTNKQATDLFFKNPVVREFPNPVFYTRKKWLQSNASISDNPLPSDPGYDEHITKLNNIFDCENEKGLLRENLITMIYSEAV